MPDLFDLEIPDDVTRCGRRHEEEEIVGYAVVYPGGIKLRDVGYFDAFSRREAFAEADWRSARVDVLYSDGCREPEWIL